MLNLFKFLKSHICLLMSKEDIMGNYEGMFSCSKLGTR